MGGFCGGGKAFKGGGGEVGVGRAELGQEMFASILSNLPETPPRRAVEFRIMICRFGRF